MKKPRYFPFDAFICHNQNDGSHLIRDELVRQGATAWHDGYADITDRVVQSRVTDGLRRSRYICVCVGRSFRDSDWVKAEYRSGLDIERRFPGARIVVLATDSSPSIPLELDRQRVFPVHAEGCEPLARFLIAENSRLSRATSSAAEAEAEKRRISRLLGLRSIMHSQTHLKLTVLEQTRLARERLAYLLAHPGAGDAGFLLGMAVYHIEQDEYRRYQKRYFTEEEHELRAVVLDMFEELSLHSEEVRNLRSAVPLFERYDFLDPLIELMLFQPEAERAARVFDTMCALLDKAWQANPVTRNDIAGFRWYAAQVRAGAPLAATRAHRNRMIESGRHSRGSIWQRLWSR